MLPMAKVRICIVPDCYNINYCKGLCSIHYDRKRKNGTFNSSILYDGRSKHELYNTYRTMINRCYRESHISFKYYGFKGIKVCDRWLKSFWNFVEDMGFRPEGHTLDRIDNNGDYEPSNCRWTNNSIQASNRNISLINSSGVKGVSFSKRNNKWKAQITKNKIRKHLGYFDHIEDAKKARRIAESC